MHPLLSLSIFWLLPLALTLEENSPLDCFPRRTVPYDSECCYLSCATLAYSVSTRVGSYGLSLVWLIGKQGLTTGGVWVNQTYSLSRGQRSLVSWGGSVQLLHHAVERRSGPASAGCQGGSVCSWPQGHLQETCLSKNTFVNNAVKANSTLEQRPLIVNISLLLKCLIRVFLAQG